eukprot:gene22944-31249_t
MNQSNEESTLNSNAAQLDLNIAPPVYSNNTNNENSSTPPPPPLPPPVVETETSNFDAIINDDEKKHLQTIESRQISRTRVRRKAIRPNSTEANLLREFVMNHQMETLGINRSAEPDEANADSSSIDEHDDNQSSHDEKRQRI